MKIKAGVRAMICRKGRSILGGRLMPRHGDAAIIHEAGRRCNATFDDRPNQGWGHAWATVEGDCGGIWAIPPEVFTPSHQAKPSMHRAPMHLDEHGHPTRRSRILYEIDGEDWERPIYCTRAAQARRVFRARPDAFVVRKLVFRPRAHCVDGRWMSGWYWVSCWGR